MSELMKKQINLQKLTQVQDQKLSNENMASTFCTIENIYFSTTKNPLYNNERFNYYKTNKFYEKSLESQIEQLSVQLHILKISIKLYNKKYKNYDFPSNFSSEEIKKYLEIWGKNENLSPYCIELQKLFFKEYQDIDNNKNLNKPMQTYLPDDLYENQESSTQQSNYKTEDKSLTNSIKLNNELDEKEKSSPNPIPLNVVINQIANIKNYINQANELVEKSFIENGESFKVTIKIDSKLEDNPLEQGVKHFEKINGATDEEIKKNFEKVTNANEEKVNDFIN